MDRLVYGVTHTTITMSNGAHTLVSQAPQVIKQEISIATGSSGTVFIAGTTFANGVSAASYVAGVSVGGGMVEVSNVPGLAYTINGPGSFIIGSSGGATMIVQILKSLGQGYSGQY